MSGRTRRARALGASVDATERQLQVLLLDYEMAREDERVLANIQGTLLSVAVALLAGLAALITTSCQFQSSVQPPDCTQIPNLLLAATPLAPLSIFSYLVLLGAVATVRSYYLRGLEEEIQGAAPTSLTAIDDALPAASLVDLTTDMVSLRRGRRGYRTLAAVVLVSNVILFGGFSIYIVLQLPATFGVPAGVLYGASVLIMAREALAATIGGRSLFQSLASSYLDNRRTAANRLPRLTDRPPKERSLFGYLLLPRPQDSIKWLFVPGMFGLGVLSAGGTSASEATRAAAVWAVLELLVYQARYQWNDMRGFFSDQEHRANKDRQRLPGPAAAARARFTASTVVVLVRLAAAGVVVYALRHLKLALPVGLATAAVFGTALAYEALRSMEARPVPSRVGQLSPVVVGFKS